MEKLLTKQMDFLPKSANILFVQPATSQVLKSFESKARVTQSLVRKYRKDSSFQRRSFIVKMCNEQPKERSKDSSGNPGQTGKSVSAPNIYFGDSNGGNNNLNGSSRDSEGDANDAVDLPLFTIKLLQKYNCPLSALPKDLILLLKNNALSEKQLRKIALIGTNSLYSFLCKVLPGLWPRLVGNPRFEFSMFVEVFIGVTTKTLSEIRKRGKRFQQEFDFYLSDIALEIIGDIALVWLLSPVVVWKGSSPQTKLFALPKHFLETGSYSWSQRMLAFCLKSFQFAVVGFLASVVGHGMTTGLVEMRRRKNPASVSNVQLAPVFMNSTQWGLFMGISSNSRYQLVNGIEAQIIDRVFEKTSPLASVCCFLLRCFNSYVGGLHWIQWARHSGIQ